MTPSVTGSKKMIVLLLWILMLSSGAVWAGEKSMKLGFIYIGPVGDVGWTYSHEQSRLKLKKVYPGVETIEVPMVDEKNTEKVLRNLIQRGVQTIFATSYDHGPGIDIVAREFPNVHFFHCSGESHLPNVTTYFGRMYEGMYLAGATTALMSKSGIVGYIGPKIIPETMRISNAFVLGARAINPDIEMTMVWTGDWYSPEKATSLARKLIDEGADVLFNGDDSAAAFQTISEKGAYAVGYYSDVTRFAPDSVLLSSSWDWSVFYNEFISEIKAGVFTKKDLWWGLKEKVVVLALSERKIPGEIETRIRKMEAEIKSGKLDIFKGPISDYNGDVKLQSGETATDADLKAMNWLMVKPASYSPVSLF